MGQDCSRCSMPTLYVTGMTRLGKGRTEKAGTEPRSASLVADALPPGQEGCVVTLPDGWRYGVSVRTGRPAVCIR